MYRSWSSTKKIIFELWTGRLSCRSRGCRLKIIIESSCGVFSLIFGSCNCSLKSIFGISHGGFSPSYMFVCLRDRMSPVCRHRDRCRLGSRDSRFSDMFGGRFFGMWSVCRKSYRCRVSSFSCLCCVPHCALCLCVDLHVHALTVFYVLIVTVFLVDD